MPFKIKLFVSFIVALLIGGAGFMLYSHSQMNKEEEMRGPLVAHHHLRMQLLVEGEAVDFGQEQFQEPYTKGQCSAGLTETPIHFHDGRDQFVHIHWDKITGGQVLKYYGLNLIGGDENEFTYQPERNIIPTTVPIRGQLIPTPAKDTNYWVYTGSESDYQERGIDEFTSQDLEEFFGVKSQITIGREQEDEFSLKHLHGHAQETIDGEAEPTQDELKALNNVLGDVVIFAQEEEPAEEEIQARFEKMLPLENSTCGG